jgi:hypothetical protein
MQGRAISWFLGKVLLLTAFIMLLFEVLFRLDYLPIITTSTMFDVKMMKFQQQHIKKVDVMAIGSSITLYELDSRMMTQACHRPYYNFGSWSLQMSNIYLLLQPLTRQYHPGYVVICSSIGDFVWPPAETYHNYADAPAFMRNVMPELFYFKDFSSIRRLIYRKQHEYPLSLDAWGGATLKYDPRDDDHKQINFPTANTPAAYRSLDSIAGMLQSQHIKLIFIQAPIRKTGIDSVRYARYRYHFNKCAAIVTQHGGSYINCFNPAIFTDSLFADTHHLKPEGAMVLSKMVIPQIKTIINQASTKKPAL